MRPMPFRRLILMCHLGWVSLITLSGAHAVVRYVNAGSGDPQPPYLTPEQASLSIQEAVAVSIAGDVIRVAPGTYDTGGAVAPGHTITSRVTIASGIRVESESGPAGTIIAGTGPHGVAAVRAVYMTNGAELAGFTISGGHTMTNSEHLVDRCGGGILMDGGGLVSGCVVQANSANYGAGAFVAGGRIMDSVFRHNAGVLTPASGGGAYLVDGGLLERCVVDHNTAHYGAGIFCDTGGEVRDSRVSRNVSAQNAGGIFCASGGVIRTSVVTGNWTKVTGGGVFCWKGGAVRNTLIIRNTATNGGGLFIQGNGLVQSCTIVTNRAVVGGGLFCWGTGRVENTIVYFNNADYGANIHHEETGCSYLFCCTDPHMPNGEGNIDQAPFFVNPSTHDFRLQLGSPCLDRGLNQDWMARQLDLNGRPRIWINGVDIGAYERNPSNPNVDTDGDGIPDWWEWANFGHVSNTMAEADADGDQYSELEEYIAGTDPTNSRSQLFLSIAWEGAWSRHLRWPSVESRFYTIRAFTNLMNPSDGWVITNRMPASSEGNEVSITQTFDQVFYQLSVSQ